uniref:protein-tyrosine-phosphatase n=1 Tax=Cyprinus carpio TaxID=7962 RepID=A0A8C2CUJ4_CYPCA
MTARFRLPAGRSYDVGALEEARERQHAQVVCNVLLLDNTVQPFRANKQDQGRILLDVVYKHLELTERDYFGLQLADDSSDSQRWLDPNKLIRKQLKSRSSELGDYSHSEHLPGYLSEYSFIPNPPQDFEKEVSEFNYLNAARTLELYGVELHYARDHCNTEIYVGVLSAGISVYKDRVRVNHFPWLKIVKISFKSKQFFIQLRKELTDYRESLLGFNMMNYRACKNLWKVCVEHHTFFRLERPVPPERNLFLQYFTLGSKFRYCGRTEAQSVQYGKERGNKNRVFGGADQRMPIIVSRVAPGTPADMCMPRLNEGDQVVLINGRDISEHTHDDVVMLIKASCEDQSGELILLVRPNAIYDVDEEQEKLDLEPDFQYIPEMSGLELSHSEADSLRSCIQLLRDGLSSGTVAAHQHQQLPINTSSNLQNVMNELNVTNKLLPWSYVCVKFIVKCHQYWPNVSASGTYGGFQVTCVSEEGNSAYLLRDLTLTHLESKEERLICQMQYLAWPDHGVPDDSSDFLNFVSQVRSKRADAPEPVVVHCSAGIGRTGVLITMETAMCLIENGQSVYPLDIVRTMRDQRAMMIQTPSQYRFVCEAILKVYDEEIVKPCKTELPVEKEE